MHTVQASTVSKPLAGAPPGWDDPTASTPLAGAPPGREDSTVSTPVVGATPGWEEEPVRIFADPCDVLSADLPKDEKRAILAHWASDACAVESRPALRWCPGLPGRAVPVDDVLAALRSLDGSGAARPRRPVLRGRGVLWTAGRGASAWRRPGSAVAQAR
jgi:hypothetical protein